MIRLKSKLTSLNQTKSAEVKILSPANCEEVRIPFQVDKTAKVVGRLAQVPPPKTVDPYDSQLINGVLVQNGFKLSLMAPEDLREYAGLTTTTIMCRQHITLSAAGVDLIKWALEGTFGAIEEIQRSSPQTKGSSETDGDDGHEAGADEEVLREELRSFLIMGCVSVTYSSTLRSVELEWEGNMMNDGVADAVMAVLLTVESSPAAVKCKFSRLLARTFEV